MVNRLRIFVLGDPEALPRTYSPSDFEPGEQWQRFLATRPVWQRIRMRWHAWSVSVRQRIEHALNLVSWSYRLWAERQSIAINHADRWHRSWSVPFSSRHLPLRRRTWLLIRDSRLIRRLVIGYLPGPGRYEQNDSALIAAWLDEHSDWIIAEAGDTEFTGYLAIYGQTPWQHNEDPRRYGLWTRSSGSRDFVLFATHGAALAELADIEEEMGPSEDELYEAEKDRRIGTWINPALVTPTVSPYWVTGVQDDPVAFDEGMQRLIERGPWVSSKEFDQYL